MRLLGRRPSHSSAAMCSACFTFLSAHRGGAEVEVTMLFADIRGSTGLAESTTLAEFHALLDRFYAIATAVVFEQDGMIDKFVGDELVALFIPLLCGDHHPEHAVAAAKALLAATGHTDRGRALGPGRCRRAYRERLVRRGRRRAPCRADRRRRRHEHCQSPGVPRRRRSDSGLSAAATAAGLDPDLERRPLELKGKAQVTEVVTLEVTPK